LAATLYLEFPHLRGFTVLGEVGAGTVLYVEFDPDGVVRGSVSRPNRQR
jgi:hypothetical protein